MSLDLGLLEVGSRDNREPREQDVHTMAQNSQASSKRRKKRNTLSFADGGTFLAKMAIPHLLAPGTGV